MNEDKPRLPLDPEDLFDDSKTCPVYRDYHFWSEYGLSNRLPSEPLGVSLFGNLVFYHN